MLNNVAASVNFLGLKRMFLFQVSLRMSKTDPPVKGHAKEEESSSVPEVSFSSLWLSV